MTAATAPWPPLALQVAYADVAWVLVVAAAVLGLLPRRALGSPARAAVVAAGVVAAVAVALHAVAGGAAAQALGLALAQPSTLLAALAAASIAAAVGRAGSGRTLPPVLPTVWAWALLIVGLGLALDTLLVIDLQAYRLGLPASPVRLAALLALAMLAAVLAWWPAQRLAALALGAALALHAVLALPTGNLWDALIDPVLWTWAAAAAVRRALAR